MGNLGSVKFLRFWFPVILYSGIIFYVSSIPNVVTPLAEVQFDKILHVVEYVPFGFLVSRGICRGNPPVSWKITGILVLSVSLLHGIGDEYHQSFVSGRNTGVVDVVMDTIGGGIGSYIYLLFTTKKLNK